MGMLKLEKTLKGEWRRLGFTVGFKGDKGNDSETGVSNDVSEARC